MSKAIDILRQPRLQVLNLIEQYSLDQLNHIPTGFNNNIVWNLGHMVAAQQGVCYRRAGIELVVNEDFFEAYKPGSKPEGLTDAAGLATVKALLISTLDQLEQDLTIDKFSNYIPWTTRYGVAINSIEDAVKFLPFHDGLHVGYIMSLRKLV